VRNVYLPRNTTRGLVGSSALLTAESAEPSDAINPYEAARLTATKRHARRRPPSPHALVGTWLQWTRSSIKHAPEPEVRADAVRLNGTLVRTARKLAKAAARQRHTNLARAPRHTARPAPRSGRGHRGSSDARAPGDGGEGPSDPDSTHRVVASRPPLLSAPPSQYATAPIRSSRRPSVPAAARCPRAETAGARGFRRFNWQLGDHVGLARVADRQESLLVLRFGDFLRFCRFRDLAKSGVPKPLSRHQESTSPVGAP
jgi:hypothetical protein